MLEKIINKLFPKKKTVIVPEIKTAPLREDQLEAVLPLLQENHPPQLIVGTAQSVGRVRDHNEDTLYAMTGILADGSTDLPFGIFIIADGMGGHLHGEIASEAAARAMAEHLCKSLYIPLLALDSPSQSIQELMEEGVTMAQRNVVRRAPGGGTTLTAALVMGDQLTMAHVGDSRAYFFTPDGRATHISQDHTLVHRLLELGQITEEEAAVHPQRNVLYRALGQAEPFRPDIQSMAFPKSGYLMLCSDGLWGLVSDADMSKIIFKAPNVNLACQQLIMAANQAGGTDNISVVLVRID